MRTFSESRHKIRRDDPVVENAINEMKVKKGNRDVKARKEAVRYIHKNVASARAKMLLAAMGPRNDKRKRLRSSPCKQGSHPGYRSKMIDRLQAFR